MAGWGRGGADDGSAASAEVMISVSDPASNVLDPNSADLTLETWIKTNDASAEIFPTTTPMARPVPQRLLSGHRRRAATPFFIWTPTAPPAGCDASTTSQFKINDGNWHQVAVSITRGTSAVIYVDGKSAGSDTSVTSYSAITVTGNVFWGRSAGGWTPFWTPPAFTPALFPPPKFSPTIRPAT